MRPVQCAAVRFGAAVPSVRASLQRSPAAPSPIGPGAMTAALVIVPADPVYAGSASAHGGRATGSRVRPREMPSGAPWMVRLFTGSGGHDVRRPARPGQEASPGVSPVNTGLVH